MTPDLQQALMTFALAVLGLLTAVIVAITPKLRAWLNAEATRASAGGHEREVAVIRGLATDAVQWAEQWMTSAQGPAKREAAAAWLWKLAHDRGIDLPMSDAEKLIEAAVKAMNDVRVSLDVSAPAATTKATRKRGPDGRFLPKEAA